LEARVGGWHGWIDPWLQLGETLSLSANHGSGFTLHSEHPVTADHPLALALQRQAASLGRGALHARQDLMRAEVQFRPRLEDNQPLYAYLHAMAEISALPPPRLVRDHLVERLLETRQPVFETLATR